MASGAAASTAADDGDCAADSLHKTWLRTQRLLRNELLARRDGNGDGNSASLRSSLDRALTLHESYYIARARSARSDPVRFLAEVSSTPLERAAHWLAGWRPTTFVHLLYTESSLHFESQLDHLLHLRGDENSGDLSPAQLLAVDAVHRRAVAGERELTRELSETQDAVVDRFPPSDSDMLMHTERLGAVIGKAEELRFRTLRELTAAVGTAQAVDLLVAVAELEIGIRRVGARPRGFRRKGA